MCNSVILGENLPKAKKGDEVEVTIRGNIVVEDGERRIDITHVDGDPVASMEEECGSCGKPRHGGEMPSAEDALITFIKLDKPRKK